MPSQAGAGKSTVTKVLEEGGSLLDQIIDEGRLGQSADERKQSKVWVSEFVNQVLKDEMTVSTDTEAMINARIAELDELISSQLNEVMHHEDFQKLEGSWRGLNYFVQQSETSTMLKIKVMNITKKELHTNLTKVAEFDQSTIFKKIYEEEYGTLGGQPFAALIGDFYFGRHPQDIEILEKMSNVAASAHAPFFAAADPKMFNWDDFTELSGPRDLAKIFDNDAYIQWRTFRESEDSKYVALAMPRVLARLPYGEETSPVEAFGYEEDVDGTDHSKYLWANAAYALASRLTDSFAKHEWCAAIRGVEGGGLVEGLPAHTFKTDDGDVAMKCPTELAITDRRENELTKLGFVPLCHYKNTTNAAFISVQSANKPVVYLSDDATANAKLSSQIPYMMAVSRFAHFLKLMMRDKIGSFMSREECQSFLNNWISKYVLLDDSADQQQKAKYPLREARIDVEEIPGKPGAYRAVAYMRPHFQLDELNVSLRLVANLPQPKGK